MHAKSTRIADNRLEQWVMPLGGMQVKRAYHHDLRIVGNAEVGQKRG